MTFINYLFLSIEYQHICQENIIDLILCSKLNFKNVYVHSLSGQICDALCTTKSFQFSF